jgi:hypothetical protein
MNMKYLLALLVFCASMAQAETRPWTSEERAWGYAAGALLVGDWLTTRNMTQRYNEGYHERNPLLGSHPSTAQVNRHFMISVPLIFLVADNWESQRKNWLMGITVIEAAMVANNLRIGLRIQY